MDPMTEVCSICGHRFDGPVDLAAHEESEHSGPETGHPAGAAEHPGEAVGGAPTVAEPAAASSSETGALQPGQAGWYTDPWNPSAMRWWDGANWSGQTAPRVAASVRNERPAEKATGTGSRQGSDAAAETAAATAGVARPSRVGALPKPPAAVVVAIGVALALIIAVVAVSGHGGGKTVASGPAAPTLPPVPSTSTPAHSLGLDSAVVTATDLGGAWTPLTPAKALTPDDYTQGVCGSPLWAKDTNGYGSAFQEGSGQYAHRVVESDVLEAPSTQVADQQRAFIASPSFVPCVKQVVAADLLSAFNTTDQPQVDQLSADPLNLSLDVPATGYVVTVGVRLLGGRVRVVFNDDVIIVFTGRYMGSLDIAWCSCTPGGQELVVPQTNLLVKRLAALPPDVAKGTSA